MKPNFSHFLGLTVMLLTLAIFSASAQEGIPSNEIPDVTFNVSPELQDEKPLLIDPAVGGERASNSREQVISSPNKTSKLKSAEGSKNPATKPEDDALSFNFLYYIIQKFKISDIVEQ